MQLPRDPWDLQDIKMEVLYHTRPYFLGIFPYIALIQALYLVGTFNFSPWNGHFSFLHGFRGFLALCIDSGAWLDRRAVRRLK